MPGVTTPVTEGNEFELYVKSVESYSRTWFSRREEPQKSFLETKAKLKQELMLRALSNSLITTEDVYAASGEWAPERLRLQQEVADQLLDHPNEDEVGTGDVYFLIGLPGSGKTTNLRPLVLAHAGLQDTPDHLQVVDADSLRVLFPEYASGLGSGVVQAECAELTYTRRQETTAGRTHMGVQGALLSRGGVTIIDVIGDPVFLPKLARKLRRMKRRVFVIQARCAVDVCIDRAKIRAVRTGRYVPLAVIRGKNGVPELALNAARDKGNLSGWAVVDTNSAPRLVESYRMDIGLPPAG